MHYPADGSIANYDNDYTKRYYKTIYCQGYEFTTQRTTELSALPKGCNTVVALSGR